MLNIFRSCIMFSQENFAQLKFCTHLTLVPNFIKESHPPPSSALNSCLLYFRQNWLSSVSKQFWENPPPSLLMQLYKQSAINGKGQGLVWGLIFV